MYQNLFLEQNLGYRALTTRLREMYKIRLPMNLVNDLIYTINPERMENRRLRKKRPKGVFVSKGTNYVYSLDGHDKLSGKYHHIHCIEVVI